MRLRRLKSKGDTIVEVLIVVIVLGVIISGTYGIATRSQRANQQVQEHTQALKVAEGQLESLRAYDGVPPSRFCINNGAIVALAGTIPTTNPQDDNFSAYDARCRQSPDGGSCPGGATYCYNIGIVKSGVDLYTVTVRWDGISGIKDNVSLVYRMPPL